MGSRRYGHWALPVGGVRVLVAGGEEMGPGSSTTIPTTAEIWDGDSGSFATVNDAGGFHGGGTLLASGKILLTPDKQDTRDHHDIGMAELWDPSVEDVVLSREEAGAWRGRDPAGALLQLREGHTVAALPDGRALVVGGRDQRGDELATAETWEPVPKNGAPRRSLRRLLRRNDEESAR